MYSTVFTSTSASCASRASHTRYAATRASRAGAASAHRCMSTLTYRRWPGGCGTWTRRYVYSIFPVYISVFISVYIQCERFRARTDFVPPGRFSSGGCARRLAGTARSSSLSFPSSCPATRRSSSTASTSPCHYAIWLFPCPRMFDVCFWTPSVTVTTSPCRSEKRENTLRMLYEYYGVISTDLFNRFT